MNFEINNFEPTEYLPYDFANRRHIGPSPQEMEKMLKLLALHAVFQICRVPYATGRELTLLLYLPKVYSTKVD